MRTIDRDKFKLRAYEAGLTITQVLKEAPVSRSAFYGYVNDSSSMKVSTIYRLSRVLGLSRQEVMDIFLNDYTDEEGYYEVKKKPAKKGRTKGR